MDLLLVDLLQQALGWIAAISLNLREPLRLLSGASLGGQLAVVPIFVNIKGLPALTTFPISIVALGAVCRVAGIDSHGSRGCSTVFVQ